MTRTALCWATIRSAGLMDLATVAGRAGYTDICVTPGMYDTARRRWSDHQLQAHLEAAGVGVAVVDPLINGLPGVPSPGHGRGPYAETFKWPERLAFDAAGALGAPIVNVAHYMATPCPHSEMVEALSALCERAATENLSISLEFMPEGGNIPDLEAALGLVSDVGADNLGIMFDTWHHYRSIARGTRYELSDVATESVIALQVSDAEESLRSVGRIAPGVDRLLPGDGAVPLAAALPALLASRPAVVAGVEVISSMLDRLPPSEAAALTYASLQRVLRGGSRGL